MREYDRWTEEQINFALKEKEQGKTMNQISRLMEQKFKVKRTGNNITQKLYYLKKAEEREKRGVKQVRTIWTEEVMNYVISQREYKKTKWTRIARRLEQYYNITTTSKNLQNQYSKMKKQKENKEEKIMYKKDYEPATRKQCRYYASLSLGENNTHAVMTLTNECYAKSLEGKFSKKFASEQIQTLEKIKSLVKDTKEKKSTKVNKGKWTAEEELYVFNNYKTASDSLVIAGVLNRTERAIQQKRTSMRKSGRWTDLQKKVYVDILEREIKTELPQKIETFVEKHGNPTTRHLSNDEKEMFEEVKEVLEEAVVERKHERSRKAWKYDEEFDLLCNFYELSIDEARARFERSYASLAQRLELIVDSEEPEYILMLKKAAKVISKRKKEEAKNAKMGYFKRRKIARKARKAKRLETKLNKLRGE